MWALDEVPKLEKNKLHTIEAVVDRLVVGAGIRTRLTDSVELALKQGEGVVRVVCVPAHGKETETLYSEKNACPDCAISFDELKPRSFSFNSPYGACPVCLGLGSQWVFDEDLVVPDKTLPLRQAIKAWRCVGHHAIIYYKYLLDAIAKQFKIDLSTPYEKLPDAQRRLLMQGSEEPLVLD